MFTIFLALAIKSLVSFFDWAHGRISKVFKKGYDEIDEKEELEQKLQRGREIMASLQANQKATDATLKDLSKKIDMLIDSDKDDIKSYITKQHHYFCY
jgi:septal ring factor EnvC (AmiA/AmiB activator)